MRVLLVSEYPELEGDEDIRQALAFAAALVYGERELIATGLALRSGKVWTTDAPYRETEAQLACRMTTLTDNQGESGLARAIAYPEMVS
jgi:hypothetical protein